MTTDALRRFEHPDDPRPTDPTEIAQRNADIAAGRLVSVPRSLLEETIAQDPEFAEYCRDRVQTSAGGPAGPLNGPPGPHSPA